MDRKKNLFVIVICTVFFFHSFAMGGRTVQGKPRGKISSNLTAPSNLIAGAVSSSQIHLSWRDNSATELGFTIEQVVPKNRGYAIVSVTNVVANTTSYDVNGLSPSTTYYFRVYAYDGDGNSGYTNVASATTTGSSSGSPTVTISATDPTAGESPLDTGQFTVTRSGSTTSSLTVYFTVSGTATQGSDYYSIGSSVTIPAGSASAAITVTPINDSIVESNETVVLSLSSTAAYTMSSPSSATVTITSEDGSTSLPTVTITATDPTATEAGPTSGQFTVARSGSTASSLTVYFTVSGTATQNSDYYGIGSYVTIPAGSASAAITVTPINDTTVENNETVVVYLSNNAAYTVGSPSSATVTITSDDGSSLPTVTITATDPTATEAGPTTGQFTITRSGSTAGSLAVYFNVGGTATLGSDYNGLGSGVMIFAGSASATIIVTPIDDTLVENNETVVLTLSNNAAYTVGSPGSATVTIVSDDGSSLPTVTITATDPTATEAGPTTGQFTVTRTGSTASALPVYFSVGGTATPGSDYNNLGTGMTIPAGATSAAMTVTPINDTLVENNETIIVTLGSNSAYTIGSPSSATVTITSDDVASLPTVSITANDPTATEAGPTTGQFTVMRSGSTTNALQVYFAVSGSATSGSDYNSIGTSVTIPSGSVSAALTVTPVNDTLVENNETVVVTLSNNAAYTIGSPGSATVTITSDDVDTNPAGVWSKSFGDVLNDRGYAVATDSLGNVIVAGSFVGTIDFGGGPCVSYNSSYSDLFIAKFSPSADHLWSKCLGGFFDDAAYGVAVDRNNNVLVTGTFGNTVDFGGGPLASAGGNDIFVAKYSSSGDYVWAKRFGNSLSDVGYAIAADGSGNVLVTGDFQNSINFGGGTFFAYDSYSDAFLMKLSPSGDHVWSKAFGGAYPDAGRGIAVDGSGNIVVTGYFEDSIDVGAGRTFTKGSDDIFLARYSPTGAYLWSKCLGSTFGDIGYGVAMDANGNVLLTGKFQGTVDFGGGSLTSGSLSYPDGFVTKYSAAGGYIWGMNLGTTFGASNGVAVDGTGNIALTGYFVGTANFGGTSPLTSAGSMDIFVVKYSANANLIWAGRFGDTTSDMGRAVAVDINGNVIVTGTFRYNVDFGYGTMTTNGYDQIFVAKLEP